MMQFDDPFSAQHESLFDDVFEFPHISRVLIFHQSGHDLFRDSFDKLVGFTTCGGCPGGKIEYAPEEMKKNGAEFIHLATGFLVGYPPCPHLEYFLKAIPEKFGLKVVAGTHPIPQKYFTVHQKLGSWDGPQWANILKPCLVNESVRKAYD